MHTSRAVRRGEVVVGGSEPDEVSWDQLGALVEQLEEGVLAIRSGLAPVDFTCWCGDRGAVDTDRLAVRFHGQLLEVGRETCQVLGVGQHRVGLCAQEVVVPDTEEPHQNGDVLLQRGVPEVLVDGVEAL